ncbi:hypothetical protein CMV_024661 [Castanea mollissima]|uniref:Uncharacterized protein n=1 Tax=Castanea mollissima TaxID=60419 RepID=A0A8J4V9E3_9ROSI|nr:hypothetical protein CMV_024661 [Castanea mollissima]
MLWSPKYQKISISNLEWRIGEEANCEGIAKKQKERIVDHWQYLPPARPLNKPLNLAANEPLLELELPQENVVVVAYSLDKDSHHVLPCDMEPSKPSKLAFPYKAPRLSGKYGPLLLSVLPRGNPTPPSGPSPNNN